MKSYFRLKLSIAMIVFALLISFTLATFDHLRLKDQAQANHLAQIQQNEDMVAYALQTIEKAYYLFGENLADRMRSISLELADRYDRNPSFRVWDFTSLKKQFGMDVYIIDRNNVITHSSYAPDIGMDFKKCCRKLAQVLDTRRASGQFFHDGIDIEQNTGKIKKYSYMATGDKQFLIQLGYSLENGLIFKQFNFLSAVQELVQKYDAIDEINILNIGGYSLGTPIEAGKLTPDRRQAFEQTLKTKETTEIRGRWNGRPATYRYVPYSSEYDSGATKDKVLEIVYNDKELQAVNSANQRTFVIQLSIVLFITIVLSFIISRRAARLMYLAFHDSLTGLQNRAAFEERLKSTIAENKSTAALLLFDLDNFKFVNDNLGHDKGDQLLQAVAQRIRSVARKQDVTFRLGGDEFVMVMPETSKEEAEKAAADIIAAIKQTCESELGFQEETITVSIGISLVPEHGVDLETLCKKADIALYASKEQGKNRYRFYAEDLG